MTATLGSRHFINTFDRHITQSVNQFYRHRWCWHQDNYVTQWGDPGYDNPESGEVEQKPLPEGLKVMGETEYSAPTSLITIHERPSRARPNLHHPRGDAYAEFTGLVRGWPVARDHQREWPVHCYGMVGVGRNY